MPRNEPPSTRGFPYPAKPFSENEDRRLRALLAEGKSVYAIAKRLRQSNRSVVLRMHELGLHVRKPNRNKSQPESDDDDGDGDSDDPLIQEAFRRRPRWRV